MPTDKRLGELRKEGQIHLSQEVVQVVSLISGFLILKALWAWFVDALRDCFITSFTLIGDAGALNAQQLQEIMIRILIKVAPPIAVVALVVAACSALAVMLQTHWNIKEKKIHLRLDMLNPINGVKRIFSIGGVVQVLKSIVKLVLIVPIAYFALAAVWPEMVMLMHLGVGDVMEFMGVTSVRLFWKIMYVLIALAIFDYIWTKYQWLKQNKMTKDEVKDERKAVEGDETTRRQIMAKGLARIAQRIRQSVPQADVVVTNPTHFAVALKYDRGKMHAPIVVAKGKGFLALRIREIAKTAGVPIVERKPLARALFHSTEVGSEIPYDLFRAVAEVLAYVYRLKNRHVFAQ